MHVLRTQKTSKSASNISNFDFGGGLAIQTRGIKQLGVEGRPIEVGGFAGSVLKPVVGKRVAMSAHIEKGLHRALPFLAEISDLLFHPAHPVLLSVEKMMDAFQYIGISMCL